MRAKTQLFVHGCAYVLYYLVAAERCVIDGEVRLANGTTAYDGRVEICLGREWGTVCDNKWGASDARVVCRQLALPTEYPDAIYRFGGGSGPIHYAGFECSGEETRLARCLVDQTLSVSNCRHSQDAGVRCTENPCVENSVRLNGEVVQICHNQQWGLVCSSDQSWRDQTSIHLVCNQVGISSELPRRAQRKLQFIDAPVILNDVACTGSETSITQCTRAGYRSVTDCTDIAVAHCEAQESCSEEESVRLTRYSSERIGRLEVCVGGLWGTVCGRQTTSDLVAVVCQQLSHDIRGRLFTEREFDYVLGGLVPIRRTNVKCTGRESAFSECSYDGADGDPTCAHEDDVIVWCSPGLCNESDIRLRDGRTATDGRVEVCINGYWGSVCDDRWDSRDAQVVCRQLNFDGPSYPLLSFGNRGESPLIHLDDVHCLGTEEKLTDCSHRGLGVHNCPKGYAEAGVICTDTFCEDGSLHLVGGDDVSRGRVVYCYEGTWYSLCADGWDEKGNEARVVCGGLGYRYESIVVDYGRGSTPILPLNIDCSVYDSHLSTCSRTELDVSHCKHVAGVNCVALCLIFGHSDCDECGRRATCEVVGRNRTPVCNCYSDCYGYGDCCPDVSHVKNCLVQECETGAVRLVGGVNDSTGILEVCGNGVWGRVCNRLQYWGPENARVVCRQLGFSDNGAYIVNGTEAKAFRTSVRPSLLGEVHCIGTESKLLDCSHSSIGRHWCGHDYTPVPDIIISCSEEATSKRYNEGTSPAGAIAGSVTVFILLTSGVLAFALVFYKYHKKKKIEMATLDIMALHETATPTVKMSTVTHGVAPINTDTEKLVHQEQPPQTTPGDPNPYCEPVSSSRQANSVPSYENRLRIPSCHVRQLTRGKFIVKYEDITLLECIGEGEFGIVYKARITSEKGSTREVAVKTLKGNFDQVEVDNFVEECLKMSRFKHANIMNLTGVCLDAGSAPLIIMPFMANGSLLRFLRMERENLVVSIENEEDEVKEVCKRLVAMCSQIACGMEYLAGEKYVHRDLAARNCMIDKNFLIKITDFGLSEDVFEKNYFRVESSKEMMKLPIKWMAPESLIDGHFSEMSDVWSYGVTMWEIFNGGKTPYPGINPLTLVQQIENGYRMPQPPNAACTEEIYGMMLVCWDISPAKRPSFRDIHSKISKYISHIGGYLEVDINPFKNFGELKSRGRKEEDEKYDNEDDQYKGNEISQVTTGMHAN